ncbi:hypothetical protein ACFQ1I_03000 [Kitasatospora arboriphila]
MQTVRTSQQITQDVIAYMEPALRAAVDRLDEPVRRMTEYHFGWVDAEGRRRHRSDSGGGPRWSPCCARAAPRRRGTPPGRPPSPAP